MGSYKSMSHIVKDDHNTQEQTGTGKLRLSNQSTIMIEQI